jgi:phosphate starvation-inducible PhoH-like protein
MQKHLTVVLQDHHILNEIFGANDGNLAVLEELLGVRIFSKGNEIFLESEDKALHQIFRDIMGRIQEHVRLGQSPGPDLIRAIHSSLQSGESEQADTLKETQVVIPNGLHKVFPRSYNQALYLRSIEERELVFGIGPAGTGKTYLAIAQALKAVISRAKRKLILTRPVVEAGESLGFLPGDLVQKISPYLRPLYDAMESLIPAETIRRLEENRTIEVAPLAYMRGRTLSDCIVILDEAQNTTREQMKMFLTRIGEGSRTIVTGDVTQIDLPRKNESGLLNVIPILRPIPEIRFIFFEGKDVVRNELVRKIVHAYEAAEQK